MTGVTVALSALAVVTAAVLQRLASLRCASCPTTTACCAKYVASGVLDISLLSTCGAALGSCSSRWVRCAGLLAATLMLLLSIAELALLYNYGQILSLALLRLALKKAFLLELSDVVLNGLPLPRFGAIVLLIAVGAATCAAALRCAAARVTVQRDESPGLASKSSRRRRMQLVCFAAAASVARLALRSEAPSTAVLPRLILEGWAQWRASRTADPTRRPRPLRRRPPQLVGSGTNEGRAGVVVVLLESLNAADVTPLYAPVASGDAPTAPWLSSLAARRGSAVGRAHLATMPNSNKALFELLTGLAPEMSTAWPELDDLAACGRGEGLRQEALPSLLARLGWASLFACPAGGAGSLQTQLGFSEVWDANASWHLCRRRRPAACNHVRVTLSAHCLRELQAKHPLSKTVRDALRTHVGAPAARAALARSSTWRTPCVSVDWSGVGSVEELLHCLDSPCLLEEAAVGSAWPSPLSATADRLTLLPTLDFAARSLARGQPFFATLFSTATHHPYVPPLLSHELKKAARHSKRYYVLHPDLPLRATYHGAVRRTDALLAELYAGLEQLGVAERTLLIVLGDHGEAFGDDGYHMHGGCIDLSCMRVPAVWHDPLGVLNTSGGLAAVPWTRHADVAPTILRWAGHRVVEGAWQGTAVRPGIALGTNRSVRARGAGGACLALFSFADADGARAVACGADGGVTYSQSDPLRHASVVHHAVRINATARPAGLTAAPVDVGHGRRHEEAERVRRELASLYASWRAAAAPLSVARRVAATEAGCGANAPNVSTARGWAETRVALRSCIARLNAKAHRTLPASHLVHSCTKCAAGRHRVWPAFLILAARGTDTEPLFLHLLRHPRVLPPKKAHPGAQRLGGPHLFGAERNRSLRSCCSYLRSFPSPRDARPACLWRGAFHLPLCKVPNATGPCLRDGYVSGDATAAALTGATPAVVRGLLPTARLIVLARCPVERLLAHGAALENHPKGKGHGGMRWHGWPQFISLASKETYLLSRLRHVPGERPWRPGKEGLVPPGMYVRWLEYWAAADWGRLQLLFAEELHAAAAAGDAALRAFLAPVFRHAGLDAAAADLADLAPHAGPAASSAPSSIMTAESRVGQALEAAVCVLYRRTNAELEASVWMGRRVPAAWRCKPVPRGWNERAAE